MDSPRQRRRPPALLIIALLTATLALLAGGTAHAGLCSDTMICDDGAGGGGSTDDATKPPIAKFTFAPTVSLPGTPVSFVSTTTGIVTSYDWTWGDGSANGTKSTTTHAFGKPGSYHVTLKVKNSKGVDTLTKTVVVAPYPQFQTPVAPQAAFDATPAAPVAGTKVVFASTSQGWVDGYDWDWGDSSAHGTTAAGSHVYKAPGLYHVTLHVTNQWGNSSATHDLAVAEAKVPGGGSPTPTPTPTPTTTPGGTQPGGGTVLPAPTPAGKPASLATLVRLPATRRCPSRRVLRITIPGATQLRTLKIAVNGHVKRTLKGSSLRVPVSLKGLPKGRYTIKLSATLRDGRTLTLIRHYRTCAHR